MDKPVKTCNVLVGRLIYRLTEPRYDALMVSIAKGAGFAFESDELSGMIDLDMNTKDVGEAACFYLQSRKDTT